MSKRRVFVSAVVALTVSGCMHIVAVVDEQPPAEAPPQVVFDVALPPVPPALPVYNQEPSAPVTSVLAMFRKRCCKQMMRAGGDTARDAAELCKGLSDDEPAQAAKLPLQTGQVSEDVEASICRLGRDKSIDIYPRLRPVLTGLKLEPARPMEERMQAAHAFLAEAITGKESLARIGPKFGPGRVLSQVVLAESSHKTPPPPDHPLLQPLVFASAQRSVPGEDRKHGPSNYRVDGPGSRFAVMIDGATRIEGLTHSWGQLTGAEPAVALRTPAQLQQEIQRQLLQLRSRGIVHVLNIELVYYDAGQTLLQPAFRYVAELGQAPPTIGRPERVVGYVAYAATAEPIPTLTEPRGHTVAASNALQSLQRAASTSTVPEVSFATYVVRDDRPSWVANASTFSEALTDGLFGARIHLAGSYAAMPEQFSVRFQDYVNRTDLALVEAHGSPGRFATLGSGLGIVGIGRPESGFPASGYGPRAGGRLRHWALHSCDVLAHPESTPWSSVFKGGVQTVVGYRSAMYITDGAEQLFAQQLAAGAPVVAAWFSTVNSLNVYQLDTMAGSHCGAQEPIGRPAALTACGAEDTSLFDVVETKRDCVRVWTTEDALIQ